MAVVNKFSGAASDTTATIPALVPGRLARAPLNQSQGIVAVANGDSIASTLHFFDLPSQAVISSASVLKHSALTSLTDFDLGDVNDPDGLIDGANLTSAGSKDVIDIADGEKELWEQLGYTADPGGMLSIYGTLKAASGADGTVLLTVFWTIGP